MIFLSFEIYDFEFFQLATTYTTSIIIGVVSFLPMGIGVVESSEASFLSFQELNYLLHIEFFLSFFTRWYGVIAGLISMKLIGLNF